MPLCTIGDCLQNKKNVKVVLPVLPKKVTCGVIISPSSSSYGIDRRTYLSAAELTMLSAHGSDEYSGEGDARELISLLFVHCSSYNPALRLDLTKYGFGTSSFEMMV